VGKLHEISFYGLIAAIVSLASGKVSLSDLWYAAFHPESFLTVFECFLFWASALFVPIAIIGAFSTKYSDGGWGLTFGSDNILVIIFAHIAEEILGIIATPFWFLKDLFAKELNDEKILDYVTYVIELIFIVVGLFSLFRT